MADTPAPAPAWAQDDQTQAAPAAPAWAADQNDGGTPPAQAPQTDGDTQQPGMVAKIASDIGTFLSTPSEPLKALAKGTVEFGKEVVHHATVLASGMGNVDPNTGEPLVADPTQAYEERKASLEAAEPTVDTTAITPKTGTGQFAAGAVQFAEGLATVNKLGPIINTGVKVVDASLKSGAAMAAFFDPYAKRLSNLVQEHPSIANPIAEFLAADPNDPEIVARLKNGLEGAGLGAVLDSTVSGVISIAKYLKGDKQGAIDAAVEAGKAANRTKAAPGLDLNLLTPEERGEYLTLVNASDNAPRGADAARLRELALKATPDQGTQLSADTNPDIAQAAKLETNGTVQRVDDSINMPRTNGEELPLVEGPRYDAQPTGAESFAAPRAQPQFTRAQIADTADYLVGNLKADSSDPFQTIPYDLAPVNPAYIVGTDSEKTLMTMVGQRVGDMFDQARGGPAVPRSFEDLKSLAEAHAQELGKDPDAYVQELMNTGKSLRDAVVKLVSSKVVATTYNNELMKHAQWLIEERPGPYASMEELSNRFDALVQRNMEIAQPTQEIRSASGELLNANKVETEADSKVAEALQQHLADVGVTSADEARSILAKRLAAARGDVESTQSILRPMWDKAVNGGVGYYINSLLGFPTVAVKATSDLVKGGIIQPAHETAAGIWRGFTSGDWTRLTQAGQQYVGMAKSIADAIEFGGKSVWDQSGKAFKEGLQILDAKGGMTEGVSHATPFEAGDGTIIANLEAGNYASAVANAVGNIVGMPARTMNLVHEFSTQVIYRGRVYAKAVSDARVAGLDADTTQELVANRMRQAFGQNGEALDQEALDFARNGTFSKPLDPNTPIGKFKEWQQDHPVSKIVVPFLTAPVRLMQDVGNYSLAPPMISMATRALRGQLTAGGEASEDAVARLVVGGALWSMGVTAATSGLITDGGPQDPDALKQKMETGWRPHSLNVNGEYIPLDRVEPLGTILSLSGDAATILPHLADQDVSQVAQHMAVAISQNAMSKTYLKNMSDFLTALTSLKKDDDADTAWGKLVRGMASGMVPSMVNRSNDDPYMREVRSVLDGLKSRIPGLSATLDPQRNVLGEPIERTPSLGPKALSPFYASPEKNDGLAQTLADVAGSNPQGFHPPPKTMRMEDGLKTKGVDLTQYKMPDGHSAYDKYQDLIRDLGDGNGTFRDQLSSVVNSDAFKSLPSGGNANYEGAQYKELNALIGARREAAKAKLLSLPESQPLVQMLVQDQQSAADTLKLGSAAPVLPPEASRKRAFAH